MRPIAWIMNNFFHNCYMLRVLKNPPKNYPDAFIESIEKRLSILAEELRKDHNVDIYAYLKTSAGQEELHKHLIEEAAMEKAGDRCNMCGAYTGAGGCQKGVMGEYVFPMKCDKFVDVGFTSRFDRIYKTIDRCHACTHHYYEDDELKCRKGLDTYELECPGQEKKP